LHIEVIILSADLLLSGLTTTSQIQRQTQEQAADGRGSEQVTYFPFLICQLSFPTEENHQWTMINKKMETALLRASLLLRLPPDPPHMLATSYKE
jgi:hypothetical protein